MEAGQISPRRRDGENLGAMNVDEFIALVTEQCSQYK
jgi:threonyl-tRNA synthetase